MLLLKNKTIVHIAFSFYKLKPRRLVADEGELEYNLLYSFLTFPKYYFVNKETSFK